MGLPDIRLPIQFALSFPRPIEKMIFERFDYLILLLVWIKKTFRIFNWHLMPWPWGCIPFERAQ
jgi:hypothetical protein